MLGSAFPSVGGMEFKSYMGRNGKGNAPAIEYHIILTGTYCMQSFHGVSILPACPRLTFGVLPDLRLPQLLGAVRLSKDEKSCATPKPTPEPPVVKGLNPRLAEARISVNGLWLQLMPSTSKMSEGGPAFCWVI
ncbi:hypothetical protein MLD38_003754 [Melastoma candidum]|uniref:Uncharacterized protein n=1 Tax=Melastoma candidum TaxID=119954 RepID=A0ACB9S6R4_9MYRT|nr:hypothetical protein MLD38_003754 [Melastoma candidum]